MLFKASTVFAVLALAFSPATAAPRPVTSRSDGYGNAITHDAPFSQTEAQFAAFPLICPYGVSQARVNKNILFIPPTAASGTNSFSKGYVPALRAQGFFPCYVNMPNHSLADAQVTSEHVVKQIDAMYARAGNRPFTISGHSQGNINIQWALNFWPSRRTKVLNYVGLSADYHGTALGQLVLAAQRATVMGGSPAVIQQSIILGRNPHYIDALNKHGNQPLVPTTSLFGQQDEVVQPIAYSSRLDNTPVPNSFSHIDLSAACAGRTAGIIDHLRTLLSAPAFWLLVDAIQTGGTADLERARNLALAQKQDFCSDIVPGATDQSLVNLVKTVWQAVIQVGTNQFLTQTTKTEPALMPYAANQP